VVPQIAAAVPQAAAPQQAIAPAVAVQQPQHAVAVPQKMSAGLEGYRKIAPDKIPGNVMKMISQDWMLITAGNREKFNMMTASWGGFGILYNKPVAICFINPARYTYSIIEGSDTFTLTFYTEAYRDALQYCGTKSGRDEDKVKGAGLTPMETQNGAMAFSQAWMVVECRKMLSQSLSPDAIADPAERAKRAAQPMHKMYIGEILNVWVK
jgi:flavin reductase (DIM6/NTAB) family NADH-FMN oxidoreductase RutF